MKFDIDLISFQVYYDFELVMCMFNMQENDNSYCVIYKKKKYDYLSTSEERGRDMKRQPKGEHKSSLASTPLQARYPTTMQRRESAAPVALSQTSNLGSATLNVLDKSDANGMGKQRRRLDLALALTNPEDISS